MAVPSAPAKGKAARKEEAPAPRRPLAIGIAVGVLVLVLLGGAALQLTPYGAFGYLAISDITRAGEYARATASAIADARAVMAPDTFDVAKKGADAAGAAHARFSRAPSLAAVAALLDCETNIRFGTDTARGARAKQLLTTLPPNQAVLYADAAGAAQLAESGDLVKGAAALDAAARNAQNAPIAGEIALIRGDVALAAGDGAAALAAFKRALERADDARAHFGLARAYDMLGDAGTAQHEIAATLAKSPQHPGALTLRARPKSTLADPAAALADLAVVLDGPARAKASPAELSAAYAARAWVSLDKGAASDARDAFAQAVTLDGRNVDALNGQGRLFLNEGRPTEALARFDTALQIRRQLAGDDRQRRGGQADARAAGRREAAARRGAREVPQEHPGAHPARQGGAPPGQQRRRRGRSARGHRVRRPGARERRAALRGAVGAALRARAAERRALGARRGEEGAAGVARARARVRRGERAAGRLRRRDHPLSRRHRARLEGRRVALPARGRAAQAPQVRRRERRVRQGGGGRQGYPGLSLERGVLFQASGDLAARHRTVQRRARQGS